MTWNTIALKRIASFAAGGTPPVDEPNYWADDDDGYPWVAIGDMSSTDTVAKTARRISVDGLRAARIRLGKPGTILFSMYATLGHTAWLTATASWNQAILGICPDMKTDARFLRYCLVSIRPQLLEQVRSNTQANLNAEVVGNLKLPNPPLDRQRRIADFLDAETARVEKLLAATTQQTELLNARRLEGIRVMVTGTGNKTSIGDTNIRWMPHIGSKYSLLKVGLSFTTGSGTTPRSSDPRFFDGAHSWINTGDLRDGPIRNSARHVSDSALQDYPTLRIYPSGSLVVAMYGATIGRAGISEMPACVNQACCVLTPLGQVDTKYAFYWFIAHRAEIVKLGSGGGQPNISQDLVRSLRIPVPDSVAEQRAIADDCLSLERENTNHQTYLSRRNLLLSERRQALITAAVTGAITV